MLFVGGYRVLFSRSHPKGFWGKRCLLPYARDFCQSTCGAHPSFSFSLRSTTLCGERISAQGHDVFFFSVGLNVILAPLFFRFQMGMKGAAFTVLSQLLGLVWVLSHFLDKKVTFILPKDFTASRLRRRKVCCLSAFRLF